jgi:hypothetical protein
MAFSNSELYLPMPSVAGDLCRMVRSVDPLNFDVEKLLTAWRI